MQRQVRLLGTPAIVDDEGRGQPVRGHQAWALLARIVLAQRPLSRQKLAAELFPESVDPLGAVRWGLAALRKALNASDCLVGDPVEPRFPSGTEIDLRQLELDTFDVGQAGDLLEGICLHALEGKAPFEKETLRQLRELKRIYGLSLTAADSHQMKEGGDAGR